MKNNIFLYLSIVLAAVAISLYTCSDNSYKRLLNQNKAILASQKDAIDNSIALKDKAIKLYQDSISDVMLKLSLLEDSLVIIRKHNSIKIAKAKKLTQKEADSVKEERFEDNSAVVIFAAECDSLFDEHISLQKRYENRVNELTLFARMNKEKDGKIEDLIDKVEVVESENSLLSSQVKEEKKKGNKKFVKGAAFGVIATIFTKIAISVYK